MESKKGKQKGKKKKAEYKMKFKEDGRRRRIEDMIFTVNYLVFLNNKN